MAKRISIVLPSLATSGSLMLGVLAIMMIGEGRFLLAMVLIVGGSILDAMDGQLADRLGTTSELGKQLDSLSDVVTFGVAPSLLIYHLLLNVGVSFPVAVAISLVFVIAGAFRLARYNTLPTDRAAWYVGLPIPMASILVITGSFWQHWVINLWWAVVVIVVSGLMASTFPYPKAHHLSRTPPLAAVAVAIAVAVAWSIAGWEAVPFGLFALYAGSGPAVWLAARHRRRREVS